MSFGEGNWGRDGRTVFGTPLYWSMAVAVLLSTGHIHERPCSHEVSIGYLRLLGWPSTKHLSFGLEQNICRLA